MVKVQNIFVFKCIYQYLRKKLKERSLHIVFVWIFVVFYHIARLSEMIQGVLVLVLLESLLILEWNVTDHLYMKIKVCFRYEVTHKYYIALFITIFLKSTWFISGDNNSLMYIFLLLHASFLPEDTGFECNFPK